MYFIGHNSSSVTMAGMGMGHVCYSACSVAFCFGLNGTLESKCSQAYGSQNYEQCGVWLNRGRTINTFLMIPISILFCMTKYLLISIGQNEVMAEDARYFCILMIPACWA
jgi:Na+-driven multidrug efflux pump